MASAAEPTGGQAQAAARAFFASQPWVGERPVEARAAAAASAPPSPNSQFFANTPLLNDRPRRPHAHAEHDRSSSAASDANPDSGLAGATNSQFFGNAPLVGRPSTSARPSEGSSEGDAANGVTRHAQRFFRNAPVVGEPPQAPPPTRIHRPVAAAPSLAVPATVTTSTYTSRVPWYYADAVAPTEPTRAPQKAVRPHSFASTREPGRTESSVVLAPPGQQREGTYAPERVRPAPRYSERLTLTPAISDAEAESIAPLPPPPPADSPSNVEPPATLPPPRTGEGLAEAERLGEAPEGTSLYFLRSSTVLLDRGQWQVDVGLNYSLSEAVLPVAVIDDATGDIEQVARGRLRQRLLLMPLEIRYGLFDRMQLFMNVPVGWSGSEFSLNGFDEFSNIAGVGDINAGTSVVLQRGKKFEPEIVGTLAMTFPTGNDSFPVLGFTPDSRLGEGFFALSANLLFVHTVDPLVLFYGVGYRHRFDADFVGREVDPGEQFVYQFGVGFAVNEYVTLSTAFQGAYVSEDYVDDDRLEGTILEPMRLRFSATISKTSTIPLWHCVVEWPTIIEPFVEIGMTEDAPAGRFGVTWTF